MKQLKISITITLIFLITTIVHSMQQKTNRFDMKLSTCMKNLKLSSIHPKQHKHNLGLIENLTDIENNIVFMIIDFCPSKEIINLMKTSRKIQQLIEQELLNTDNKKLTRFQTYFLQAFYNSEKQENILHALGKINNQKILGTLLSNIDNSIAHNAIAQQLSEHNHHAQPPLAIAIACSNQQALQWFMQKYKKHPHLKFNLRLPTATHHRYNNHDMNNNVLMDLLHILFGHQRLTDECARDISYKFFIKNQLNLSVDNDLFDRYATGLLNGLIFICKNSWLKKIVLSGLAISSNTCRFARIATPVVLGFLHAQKQTFLAPSYYTLALTVILGSLGWEVTTKALAHTIEVIAKLA